ncbi:NTP transferase domain-containing protein [Aequorivita echinoideorum]|uniref:Probable molybdenum cofactor guanylyltransferase n=1 Tax=Aequorivita echinoideorum TaxID=1549647 RepID=A0ABS5S4J2_9FLAO|nr:NTP transferase domain-containing protein [Aequorivita echinoideorum]MBT0608116.1 NTP transferase domain-containing protein [Aequorivita echinoideorum]
MKTECYGLVLAGGRSTRMGADKGEIEYHGKPHREFLYQLLEKFCDEVFLSVRPNQTENLNHNFKTITDTDAFRGPFNGLFSAHKKYPKVAWLVVATDLPLFNETALQQLIKSRNKNKIATAFATKQSGLPEPLCAIWEPSAFSKAASFFEEHQSSCPRKFLINSDIELIFPENDDVLINANKPEEYQLALKKLQIIEP